MMVSIAFCGVISSSLRTCVCAIQRLTEAVKLVLLPIMKSIKDDLNSVKGELTSLNKTVSHLSGDLEQQKNQTTSVLADLQSSINKSHTEQLNLIHDEMESVLTEKLTHIEDRLDDLDSKLVSVNTTSEMMRGDLRSVKKKVTSLNEALSHLNGDLEQHKTQTASLQADLLLYINLTSTMTYCFYCY